MQKLRQPISQALLLLVLVGCVGEPTPEIDCVGACDDLTPNPAADVLIIDGNLDSGAVSLDAQNLGDYYQRRGFRAQVIAGLTPGELEGFVEASRSTYQRIIYTGHHGYDGPLLQPGPSLHRDYSQGRVSERQVSYQVQIGLTVQESYVWNSAAGDLGFGAQGNAFENAENEFGFSDMMSRPSRQEWIDLVDCIGRYAFGAPTAVIDGNDRHWRERQLAYWFLYSRHSRYSTFGTYPHCVGAFSMIARHPIFGFAFLPETVERDDFDQFTSRLSQRLAGSGVVILHGCNSAATDARGSVLLSAYGAASFSELLSRRTQRRVVGPTDLTSCTRLETNVVAIEAYLAGQTSWPVQTLGVYNNGNLETFLRP